MIKTLIAVLVPTLVAYIATFPLIRASKADRDTKLMVTFVDLMARAQARGGERTLGAAEQVAAISAVAEMGRRHPTLWRPALWGLRSIDQFYDDKAVFLSLPESLQSLEEFKPPWWQRDR